MAKRRLENVSNRLNKRFKMSEEGVSFIDMIETSTFGMIPRKNIFNWYKTSTDTLNNKNNK